MKRKSGAILFEVMTCTKKKRVYPFEGQERTFALKIDLDFIFLLQSCNAGIKSPVSIILVCCMVV